MGGIGSGRRAVHRLTSEYLKLDVRALQRAGMLHPGHIGSWSWRFGGEVRAAVVIEGHADQICLRHVVGGSAGYGSAYSVRLNRTVCAFGGTRPWFQCPKCCERAAVLYGGTQFVCRRCRRLAYAVQRETGSDRLLRRADAIRRRLDWVPGVLNAMGGRPRGMHRSTYLRLLSEYNRLMMAGFNGFSEQLHSVDSTLRRVERQMRALMR